MDEAFDMDELRDLAFELQIDFENMEGETKKQKIRSIVGHYYRMNLLEVFIGNLEAERPDHDWPKVED